MIPLWWIKPNQGQQIYPNYDVFACKGVFLCTKQGVESSLFRIESGTGNAMQDNQNPISGARQPSGEIPKLTLVDDQEQWFLSEVKPHEPMLRAYLQQKFPWLDGIDDVIQDTYIRLFRTLKRDSVKSPKAFLFRTAHNLIYDLFRRKQVVAFESLTEIAESFVLDKGNPVPNQVSEQEELTMLSSAIEELPKGCRRVMTLRFVYGLKTQEIAEELNLSPNTVKAHLAKGIQRCSDYLKCRYP
jgi:RNA polymerase sigma-70 factor (ECF subfamily)